jgi:SOS-response transcriptional repressor LexA
MHKTDQTLHKHEHEALVTIGKNITYLMLKKGIDSAHLSAVSGLGTATINSMRRGTGNPTLATIVSMAQFLEVSLSELTEIDLEKQANSHKRIKTIPLINLNEINEFFDKTLEIYDTYTTEIDISEKSGFFAITINNDSLYPQFSSGTICIVTIDDSPIDGDIVLVKINNHAPCFRRIYIEDSGFLFTTVSLEQDAVPSTYKCYAIVGILVKTIKSFT